MAQSEEKKAVSLTSVKLVIFAVLMFIFCLFVMPPIYTLFCEVTGLNGKTKGQYQATEVKVDTSRLVKVQFVATKNENMPWGFKPAERILEVHPGESVLTHFVATNPTESVMVGQAVPSLVPHNATDFFHKTECFCFNQQVLAAGETADLGLQFIVDQDIPKGVNTIILSYTLFDVTENSKDLVEQKQQELTTATQAAAELITNNI